MDGRVGSHLIRKLFSIRKAVAAGLAAALLLLVFLPTALAVTPDDVVSFFNSKLGHEYNDRKGKCLGWVAERWVEMGFPRGAAGEYSAKTYWNTLVSRGVAHQKDTNPPIGADLFFDGEYGHIGVHVGNGYVIHLYTVKDQNGNAIRAYVKKDSIFDGKWYQTNYLGWAWHDYVSITFRIGFDVNFKVNGQSREHIDGIGNISLSVGGVTQNYQDKQHSSATGTYSDFCQMVDSGKNYQLTVNITDPNYRLFGCSTGSLTGTTGSADMQVCLDIRSVDKTDSDFYATVSHDSSLGFLEAASDGSVRIGSPSEQAYDTDPKHIWRFIRQSDGTYKIRSEYNGKYLNAAGAATADGTAIQTAAGSDSAAQKWYLCPDDSKSYARYSIASSYCRGAIDKPDSYTSTGQNVQLFTANYTDAQLFQIHNLAYSEYSYPGRQKPPVPTIDVSSEDTTVKLSWRSKTASNFDARAYNVAVYAGETASGTAVFKKTGTTATSATTQLSQGTYTVSVTAINTKYSGLTASATKTFTVYARYTLKFDGNGGTGAPDDITVEHGGAIHLPTTVPKRTGYVFRGWNTDPKAGTALYQPGDEYPGGGATLYAVWEIRHLTVKFDSDGAGNYDPVTVDYGGTIPSLPVPAKQGMFFQGWFTAAGKAVTTATVIKSNMTLTARWAAPTKMVLPASVKSIESEAFYGDAANEVVIPGTVTSVGSKAFANNKGLYTVIVYSRTVSPASNAFVNCPNLTIAGYNGTPIQEYAAANGIPFVAIGEASGWIPDTELPVGARVIDNKWTYTTKKKVTTTSTETSLDGWKRTGFTWKKDGTGTWKYASYPAGFDTGSSLYTKYNKSALAEGESSTGSTTKRDVKKDDSLYSYIYWHWTFTDYVGDTNRNVLVEDARKLGVNVGGSVTRDFIYFDAFETAASLNKEGMSTSGLKTFDNLWSTYHHPEYNLPEYASWWWYRFEVRQQSYTDYRKLFSYEKEESVTMESTSKVTEGDGISDVRHWVRYKFE